MTSHASSRANRPRARGTRRMSGVFCFQPPPQQQQPALQVVLPFRQVQRLVQPQLAVGEFLPPRALALVQQSPENLRRQAADQVFAVEQDALVGGVIDDVASRRGARWRRRRRPRRRRRGASTRASRGLGRSLLELHVLHGDREVAAQQLDRRLVFLVEAIRHVALEAQHADQLAAHQQRHAELTFRIGEAGHRDAAAAVTPAAASAASLCIAKA